MKTPITDTTLENWANEGIARETIIPAMRRLELDRAELMEAIEEYFIAYANEGKKPGWIGRITSAKTKIEAALSAARANFPD